MTTKSDDLRRYTDLTALFSLLSERKLVLRDPRNWDDANDRYYMNQYKKAKKLKSVLAVCFVQSPERYHFWQVFAPGRSGVQIQFKRNEFLRAVERETGVRMGSVRYELLKRIRVADIDDLPFVKRQGFEDENEFRIIYESSTETITQSGISIPLSCIESVKLNPWLYRDTFPHVRKALRKIHGCGLLTVEHSHLIESETWKKAADAAVAKFNVDRD